MKKQKTSTTNTNTNNKTQSHIQTPTQKTKINKKNSLCSTCTHTNRSSIDRGKKNEGTPVKIKRASSAAQQYNQIIDFKVNASGKRVQMSQKRNKKKQVQRNVKGFQSTQIQLKTQKKKQKYIQQKVKNINKKKISQAQSPHKHQKIRKQQKAVSSEIFYNNLQRNIIIPQQKSKKFYINQQQNEASRQLQNQRLQMLKLYIKQDSQRIQRLKKIRDEHVINQISFTQQALKSNNNIIAPNFKQNIFRQQLQKFRKMHQQAFQDHLKQISQVKLQLKQQRINRTNLQKSLKQSQQQIKLLTSQIQQKNKNIQKARAQTLQQRLKKQSIQLQMIALKSKLEKLNNQLNQSHIQNKNNKQKLQKNKYQMQYIKSNTEQVLQIIRSDIQSVDECVQLE